MNAVKVLILSIFIAVTAMGPCQIVAAQGDVVILRREEKSEDGHKPRQRVPAYSPVYCQVGADYVTFFCRYEAVGEITVTDADGAVIATEVGELSAGYTVLLPGGVAPGMTLDVTIGDITYSATI